jgi:membrane protease YdiL (CAAX protease family)
LDHRNKMKEIFSYIKNPCKFIYGKDKEKQPLLYFIVFIFGVSLFTVALILVMVFIDNMLGLREPDASYDITETKNNLTGFFILLLFLPPIKEEIKYRLFLTKFNINYVLISLSLIFSDFLVLDLMRHFYFGKESLEILGERIFMEFLVILFTTIIFFSWKNFFKKHEERIKSIWEKNLSIFVYSSITLFILYHILFINRQGTINIIWVIFFSGYQAVIFSFIRAKFSIIHSMVYHFLYNFPIYLLSYLSLL